MGGAAGEGGAGARSWLTLCEGLVGGIHHALNNRMAAVRAVGQVLESDLPADHPLGGALTAEIQKLEQTATLLALLGSGGSDEPQPLQVESVAADAARLFEMHHSLRDRTLATDTAAGLLPVLAPPAPLLRAILLMLGLAVRDGATALTLEVTGDERVVRIRARVGERSDLDLDDPELRGLTGEGLREAAELAGAELSAPLELSVLTLPEARRREKGM